MPVNATERAYLSDLIAGVMSFEEDTKTNFNYASVTVGGSATIPAIGVPVIWSNANSRFEVYVAQDIGAAMATGTSPLKGDAAIAIVVGTANGLGFNKADTDLSAGDVTMTVLYRGDAIIKNEGMVWGSAAAPAQALFLTQLEEQRITTTADAVAAEASYL
jgi:hypothetical protein